MTGITLSNFRCFGTEQTVPLAPLTLLVGENSTGKTSFMAMVRALSDLVTCGIEPNFSEPPYDLGSFDEILYNDSQTNNGGSFSAGCSLNSGIKSNGGEAPYHFKVEFREKASIPALRTLKVSRNQTWIECILGSDHTASVHCGVGENLWEFRLPLETFEANDDKNELVFSSFSNLGASIHWALLGPNRSDESLMIRNGSKKPSPEELESLQALCFDTLMQSSMKLRAFASAPLRSSPQRTYEMSPMTRDIEGKHIPIYLTQLSYCGDDEWAKLKRTLERFGRSSGLFHEIYVKKLGGRGGAPFQVEIGLSQRGKAVPNRNLTDVGYGVSQALLVLTELLRPDARHLLLLQHPEVHLHPRAQAALGSLFCRIPRRGRQIVVETHSDYILDRVRMDVREKKGRVRHEDVVILFFHRSGSNVKIHPLRLDSAGNLVNAPARYRQFFMQEMNRLFRY